MKFMCKGENLQAVSMLSVQVSCLTSNLCLSLNHLTTYIPVMCLAFLFRETNVYSLS